MDDARVWVRGMAESDEAVLARHQAASTLEAARYRGRIEEGPVPEGPEVRLIAGIGGSELGSLVVHQRADDTWLIEHLFVVEEGREIGVGDALVRECINEVIARGGRRILARALPGDRSMKNLFERHGLVAQMIVVGRTLTDSAT